MFKKTSKKNNKNKTTVRDIFLRKLTIKQRKTKKPIIVCMVGLVGSGKSTIARKIAKHIYATVVNADLVRVEQRKRNESYNRTRAVVESMTLKIIEQGGNVVIDSDHIDPKKRKQIKEKAKKVGAKVIFVRVYCSLDIGIGRAIGASHKNTPGDFFGGASSSWKGDKKGNIIEIREMLRRAPQHYRWVNKYGGVWELKNCPGLFGDVNTNDSRKASKEARKLSKKILKIG